jgi:hypothetical protein
LRIIACFSIIFFYGIYFQLPLNAMTAADKEEYEKLGLSQVEWEMIQKSHMSKGKLYGLLKCGVSIPEYFKNPWKELDISEGEWLDRRCKGQSSSEIRTSEINQQAGVKRISSTEWMPIQSFFLPGLNQFKRKQTVKGYVMSGWAVASIGFFIIHSATEQALQPFDLLLLVPDMLWSCIDIGIQIQRENNPDAARFSLGSPSGKIYLKVVLPL